MSRRSVRKQCCGEPLESRSHDHATTLDEREGGFKGHVVSRRISGTFGRTFPPLSSGVGTRFWMCGQADSRIVARSAATREKPHGCRRAVDLAGTGLDPHRVHKRRAGGLQEIFRSRRRSRVGLLRFAPFPQKVTLSCGLRFQEQQSLRLFYEFFMCALRAVVCNGK